MTFTSKILWSALTTFFWYLSHGSDELPVFMQVADLVIDTELPLKRKISLKAINGILPKEIAIIGSETMEAMHMLDFIPESRPMSIGLSGKNPLWIIAWRCFYIRRGERISRRILAWFNDFECFSNSLQKSSIFDVKKIRLLEQRTELLTYNANRFLRGMVRAISGNLLKWITTIARFGDEPIIIDKKR